MGARFWGNAGEKDELQKALVPQMLQTDRRELLLLYHLCSSDRAADLWAPQIDVTQLDVGQKSLYLFHMH